MKSLLRLFALLLPLLYLSTYADDAAAFDLPIRLNVAPDSPEIDGAGLRDAVSHELQTPVTLDEDVDPVVFTLAISIDRDLAELVVERRDQTSGISRRVPLPHDRDELLRVATYLAGNLARDEASEVLRQLTPRPPAAARPAPSPVEPKPTARNQAQAALPAPAESRFWFGVQGEFDEVSVTGSDHACATSEYSCLATGGGPPQVATGPSSKSVISGGFAAANVRAVASFEYVTTPNLLAGLRVGYVANTYPGTGPRAFPPLHVEARGTWVFGRGPFAAVGLRPYVMAAGGVAQWSSGVVTGLVPSGGAGAGENITAWRVAGPYFVSTGTGARWAITSDAALLLGARGTFAFGTNPSLAALGLELGFQFGI